MYIDMQNKRVQHPYKKDYTCIIVKVNCNCPCHTIKGMMHLMPCCNNGFINKITKEEKKK